VKEQVKRKRTWQAANRSNSLVRQGTHKVGAYNFRNKKSMNLGKMKRLLHKIFAGLSGSATVQTKPPYFMNPVLIDNFGGAADLDCKKKNKDKTPRFLRTIPMVRHCNVTQAR